MFHDNTETSAIFICNSKTTVYFAARTCYNDSIIVCGMVKL